MILSAIVPELRLEIRIVQSLRFRSSLPLFNQEEVILTIRDLN